MDLDKHALNDIKRLENEIEALKQYRKDLYEHLQQVKSMTSKLLLHLRRYKRYNGKVSYYITIDRIYENGITEKVINEEYEGTERNRAFKRYNELLKQYPNIEATKDIEKSRWEK
jgi:hypothetical protein